MQEKNLKNGKMVILKGSIPEIFFVIVPFPDNFSDTSKKQRAGKSGFLPKVEKRIKVRRLKTRRISILSFRKTVSINASVIGIV